MTKDGKKDILGFYISENEGASFCAGVLASLKERGLEDVIKKWNKPVSNWELIISQLDIHFPNRLKLDLHS